MEGISTPRQGNLAASSIMFMEGTDRSDSARLPDPVLHDSLHKSIVRRIRQRHRSVRNWKKPVLQIPFCVKVVSMPEKDEHLGHFFMVKGESGEVLRFSSSSRKVLLLAKHSLVRSMTGRRRLPFSHKTPRQMAREAGWF